MTPDRQHLIDALNERLASKELTFGCKLRGYEQDFIFYRFKDDGFYAILNDEIVSVLPWKADSYFWNEKCGEKEDLGFPDLDSLLSRRFKIIGHPVTFGRVIQVYKEESEGKIFPFYRFWSLSNLWDSQNDSLESQSDDCLRFLAGIFLNEKP